MARYVVLLRGINVGKHTRVAMADLRALLADLGHTAVRTHLNSGNALFSTPDTVAAEPAELNARIEAAITDRLGLTVRCMVRTAAELRAVPAGHPFADVATDGSRMFALFLSAAPDPRLVAAHDPAELDPGRVRHGERVVYHWCPDGLLAAPPVGATVEKRWAVAVTARNWNTVTRLVDLL